MKGIYFDGKQPVYREDLPVPEADAEHSVIRVARANVCSTDKEILRGYRPDFQGIMGHEFAGEVVASLDPAWQGKRVVGEINEGCGHCLYCRSGLEKHCPERKCIGIDGADGCFAEYVKVANHCLHELPDALPFEQAVFAEPLAAALEIPEQVHIRPETRVAVIGDGRLAFMVAQVLALTGCDLHVLGKHEDKLATFAPYATTALISAFAHPDPCRDTFDIIVECSGHPSGMELASRLIRRRGTIILKSTYAGKTEIDLSYYAVNEITITGSRCGPFAPAVKLLAKGLIHLPDPEIHALKDFEQAFSSQAFKAGFDPSL